MTHRLPLSAAIVTVFAVVAACGLVDSLPPPGSGEVDIGFIDVGDVSLTSVDYTISGNGITPIEGRISLIDPSSTPTAIVGIPAGLQYLLEMRGTTSDGKGQCYGASSFDVAAREAANVMITLVCGFPTMVRTIMVDGMTDYCPWISSASASASTAVVGGPPLMLTATAGSYYSDPPMFSWTATEGILSSPHASVCAYSCTVPGMQTITATITDGYCPDSATLLVTCLPGPNVDGGTGAAADASSEIRVEDGGML